MNILFNSSSRTPKFKCDCLDPCSQYKYKFYVNIICLLCIYVPLIDFIIQIKEKKDLEKNSTILRINAETFAVTGTEEHLGWYYVMYSFWNKCLISRKYLFSVFDYYALMISIGGYLGLFIGLSLSDVCGFLVDAVHLMFPPNK